MTVRPRPAIFRADADEGGQTIVLVALLFVVLMGFAALSLDVGRFYAERRYLQNAVDSAALACARAYSQAGTPQSAWNAADNILQHFDLKSDPIGAVISYPGAGDQVSGYTAPLVYANSIVTDQNLIGGIKPIATPLGCRVAITVNVPTFFIKLVQPSLAQIGMVTKAYATSVGGFLPSVTYRYSSGPGPGDGNANNFIAWTMQDGQDYQCTVASDVNCTNATPATPGRDHIIFGAGAKATNDSSFRGYIGLDIRNFQPDASGTLIHDAYNGVSPTATVNTLKSFEGQWIDKGYPGPDICVVDPANFLPCAEISALDGSSSGIFITDYNQFFKVGDTLMLQLYDGTVKSIPDFTLQGPNLTVPTTTGSVASSTVQYTMNSQFQASGSVISTELYYDDGSLTGGAGDQSGTNPFMTAAISPCAPAAPPLGREACGTFALNPTPVNASSYNQTWSGMTATGAQQGIYQAWLRGNATAPYNQRQHDSLITVTVGNQARDFNLTSSTGVVSVAAPGTQADFSVRVRSGNGSTAWNGGASSIHLTWEQCPVFTDPVTGLQTQLSCKINGSSSTTSADVSVGSGSSVESTFNVDTTAAGSDRSYIGWIRGYGHDSSGHPVNHLFQVTVQVSVVSGGVTSYVDVIGYAAFRITAVDSNDVSGVAISKAVNDPNDPALAIGRKMRLVPWETP